MKNPVRFLAVVVCAATMAYGQRTNLVPQPFVTDALQQPGSPAAPSALDIVTGYRDSASNLQSKTKVALRLPTFVPYDDDKDNPLFAAVLTAAPDNYQIELAWAPDCNGGGACHLGYISGSTKSLLGNQGPKVPVALNGGIKGYFVDAGCGANCDDSAIYWADGDYHYSISMKAEAMETLTKMVNSAIPQGAAPASGSGVKSSGQAAKTP